MLDARLPHLGRAQQASDMIGTKRRLLAIRHHPAEKSMS
jgi:hypothetical protein